MGLFDFFIKNMKGSKIDSTEENTICNFFNRMDEMVTTKPSNIEKNIKVQQPTTENYNGELEFCDGKKQKFPSGTLVIDEEFCKRKDLKKVTLPISITEIGELAFSYCENLEEIVFSQKLTTIRKSAFIFCKKLKRITLPASIKTIESHAFAYCEQLEVDSIPETTKVEEFAFIGCKKKPNNIRFVKSTATESTHFDYPRTIWSSVRYCGHDFEAEYIKMIREGNKYFLVGVYDPFPGGMGEETHGKKVQIPDNMIYKSDNELELYFRQKTF